MSSTMYIQIGDIVPFSADGALATLTMYIQIGDIVPFSADGALATLIFWSEIVVRPSCDRGTGEPAYAGTRNGTSRPAGM